MKSLNDIKGEYKELIRDGVSDAHIKIAISKARGNRKVALRLALDEIEQERRRKNV
jgi:hypothetical protein